MEINKNSFELTENEIIKYNVWLKTLPKISNDYFGMVGGGYWFKFIPTGIGMITLAGRADVPELDIDLTDYDNW